MFNLKKVLIIFILIFSFSNLFAKERITMAYFDLPPYSYYDENSYKEKGAVIDYFNNIADELGYKVNWVGPISFSGIIRFLKAGKIDGALLLSKDKKREKFINFSKHPFYSMNSILVLRNSDNLFEINDISDLKDYKIGYLKDSFIGEFFKKNLKKVNFDFVDSKDWVKINLNNLIDNKIDAVYDQNSNTMLFEALKLNIFDKIKIIQLPEKADDVYVGFSKNSKIDYKFLKKYEEILKEKNIEFETFLNRYVKSF